MWSGSFTRIDDFILAWLTSLPGRSTTFDALMTQLPRGEPTNGPLIISIFWWYWFRKSDPAVTQRTREHLLGTMFAAAVGLFAARFLAATLPFRLRPRFEPDLHLVWPGAPTSLSLVDWSAFPSDHAVMFSALAVGLCFVSWRVGLAALVYAIVIVSFPRVYFGIHYPTDVIAGLALGALAAYCMNGVAVRRRLLGRVLLWEQRSPQAFYVGLFVVTFQFATMFNSVRHAARAVFRLLARP
ncbi:MAG TPA: phosphatase PAP2 family protein [Steroidobacteraceae bacterium]|jgi:undecaprenyl-diphosphatase